MVSTLIVTPKFRQVAPKIGMKVILFKNIQKTIILLNDLFACIYNIL